MTRLSRRRLAPICLVVATGALAAVALAAERTRVTFPESLDGLVHYSTVKRGEVTEHMLTSPAAIDAARAGRELPAGTHVVLEKADVKYRFVIDMASLKQQAA